MGRCLFYFLALAGGQSWAADDLRDGGRIFTNERFYNAQVSRLNAVQVELRVIYQNAKLSPEARVELVSSEMREIVLPDLTLRRQEFWAQTRIDKMMPLDGHKNVWSYTLQGALEAKAPNSFVTKNFAFYLRVYPTGKPVPASDAANAGQREFEVRGSEAPYGYFVSRLSSPIFASDERERIDENNPKWALGAIDVIMADRERILGVLPPQTRQPPH